MKPLFLAALLATGWPAVAAEPSRAPHYFELVSRWANRPVAELEAEAAGGDGAAQFYVGKTLVMGRGIPRDVTRGLALLRQSAAQGNPEAMAELGERLFLGEGVAEDFDEALRLARAASERGSGAGLNLLGMLQATGIGMPASAVDALKLYQRAAAAGSPAAMRTIARAHLGGRFGFQSDAAEANRWYQRAAETGDPKAMNAYGYSLLTGRGVTTNQVEAVQWILRAAALGDADGLRSLASRPDTEPDSLLGGWRLAARMGDVGAQYHLARLIATGEAEPQGPDEHPHRLLEAAAEGEHIEAALMLGDRYRWGYGGPRDLVAAARWFLHGASFVGDLDNSSAKLRVSINSQDPALPGGLNNWFGMADWKRRRTSPEDAELADVMDRYQRAVTRRDAEAMREIAHFYQRGLHVPGDPVEAAAWLLLAQQSGSARAAAEADAALKLLSVEQQQRARERVARLLKRAF